MGDRGCCGERITNRASGKLTKKTRAGRDRVGQHDLRCSTKIRAMTPQTSACFMPPLRSGGRHRYTKPTVRMAPHVEGGRTADVPWRLLLGGQGTNRDTFLGNIPLRCIFEAIRLNAAEQDQRTAGGQRRGVARRHGHGRRFSAPRGNLDRTETVPLARVSDGSEPATSTSTLMAARFPRS